MIASIVVLTPDKHVSQTIGLKKTSLIPNDFRTKYPNLSIGSYLVDKNTTTDTLAEHFAQVPSQISGVILLCDNRLWNLVKDLTTPLFTVLFDHGLGEKTVHNYFGMILSRVVKAFASYHHRFEDEKNRKLLILPLRNFRAAELNQLHLLFRDGVTANGQFSNSLDALLKALRKRQNPKTESTYSTTYIVDDKDRYFEYGKEIHCQLESGVPPHNRICDISGSYRFGKRYDRSRHFNVSLAQEQIAGTFEDCHGEAAARGPRSHINMFPNDFFGTN